MKVTQKQAKKVLAVASGGGHWIQLLRLRPAFIGSRCVFVSVDDSYRDKVAPNRFYTVAEGNRSTKAKLLMAALKLLYIIARERPNVIVTTGAAHGYLAIRIGKLFGAKGLFIDSIANAQKLSLSGELSVAHSELFLTQWPDLSDDTDVHYRGSVI